MAVTAMIDWGMVRNEAADAVTHRHRESESSAPVNDRSPAPARPVVTEAEVIAAAFGGNSTCK